MIIIVIAVDTSSNFNSQPYSRDPLHTIINTSGSEKYKSYSQHYGKVLSKRLRLLKEPRIQPRSSQSEHKGYCPSGRTQVNLLCSEATCTTLGIENRNTPWRPHTLLLRSLSRQQNCFRHSACKQGFRKKSYLLILQSII